jgi:hypothetical protein
MSFSPNLFLSNMRAKGGPAKTNRFEVMLPIPRYVGENIEQNEWERILNFPTTIVSDVTNKIFGGKSKDAKDDSQPDISRYLALQCETAELPGKTLQTADVKVYGPTYKIPYQTQYQETTLTFICTNDFYERKLFEKWLLAIMPYDTNNLRFSNDFENKTRYLTNITIMQYNESVKQIFAVELQDAFPVGMASQQLSWSDDSFHRLSIQFSYKKYKPIYEGNTDTSRILETLIGSAAARGQAAVGRGVSNIVGGVTSRVPGLFN